MKNTQHLLFFPMFFFPQNLENKGQNSPARALPWLESKPRRQRDVEGFCSLNTAVFASPSDAGNRKGLKRHQLHLASPGQKFPLAPHRFIKETGFMAAKSGASHSQEQRTWEWILCCPRACPGASCPASENHSMMGTALRT